MIIITLYGELGTVYCKYELDTTTYPIAIGIKVAKHDFQSLAMSIQGVHVHYLACNKYTQYTIITNDQTINQAIQQSIKRSINQTITITLAAAATTTTTTTTTTATATTTAAAATTATASLPASVVCLFIEKCSKN